MHETSVSADSGHKHPKPRSKRRQ